MDELPLVSIIVPSYNQGKYIRQTLESILGQDYPRIEVLVVDGFSTDETTEILRSYGDRIWFVSEPDKGQTSALNKGIDRAKGEIIGWLNSDDVYLFRTTITTIVEIFANNAAVDLTYGDYIRIDEDGVLLKPYRVWHKVKMMRLIRTCYISQPTVFFRRRAFERIRPNDSLHYGMDLELWLQACRAGLVFKHAGRFLAAERIHSLAKTVKDWDRSVAETRILKVAYVGVAAAAKNSQLTLLDLAGMFAFRIRALQDVIALRRRHDTTVPLHHRPMAKTLALQFRRA